MFRYLFSVNRCRNRLKVLYSRLQRNDLSVQKYRKIISRIEETEDKLARLSYENKEKQHTVKFLIKNGLLNSHIEFLRKHSAPLGKNEKWLQTLDLFSCVYTHEGGLSDEIISYVLNMAPYNVSYLFALYEKFYAQHLNLKIEENFVPSALLPPEERKDFLGLIDYSALKKDPSLQKIAKDVLLLCNPMDGGLGSSLKRIDYLQKIWDEIKRNKSKGLRLSAKGQDLYFDVELKGFNQEGKDEIISLKVSITELKYLQAIIQSDNYAELIVQEFVNHESIEPIDEFLDSHIFLMDLIDKRPGSRRRTYRQIIEEKPNMSFSNEMVLQAALPTIESARNRLTIERTAPGGHGQLGYMALFDALRTDLPLDRTFIRVIYNGDGPNNFVDNYIIGYMVKNRLPLALITTTKTSIDRKGGQIGVQKSEEGGERLQIFELAQAEKAEQKELFYGIGLPGQDKARFGEPQQQYFNTNIALINYTVLVPFLRDLQEVAGPKKFSEIITPDLIENEKEQNGKKFIQLEGGLASSLLNLDGFIRTTSDAGIKELLIKHSLDKLLYIINLDTKVRSELFTPVKYAYDYWFFAYSDHFKIDPLTFKLKKIKSSQLPGFNLGDYYEDVQHCIDAFGRASTVGLDYLQIHGRVHIKDACLRGRVEIISESARIVDLNEADSSGLKRDKHRRLILENIRLSIDEKGNVKSAESLNQA